MWKVVRRDKRQRMGNGSMKLDKLPPSMIYVRCYATFFIKSRQNECAGIVERCLFKE